LEATELDTGLNNQHALITGASGGIGIELTKAFVKENAKVSAVYNTSKEVLEQIHSDYQHNLSIFQADVRKESEIKLLFDLAVANFGRVDILVANAGIWMSEDTTISDMPLEQWQNTIAVNLTGAYLCSKYFFQNLERNPGDTASLILIGSTAGVFGEAKHADYASSKAALYGLMMSLKNEIVHFTPRGRVNLVNPGWTLTPMAEESLSNHDDVKRILQTIPLRKIATPKDIANMVVYLASDKLAGHLSGQSLTIAGGMEGRVLFSEEEIDPSKVGPSD
jgi:NAD(P)-dependent dehydrogenase (short-subunit alcohol dehydrogenase family)